jgi:hypothetical protein
MPDNVVLTWAAAQDNTMRFTDCLYALGVYDAQGPQHLLGGGGTMSFQTGPRIGEIRCRMVHKFLAEFPLADWLLMLDSDMTFERDLLEELLAHADPKEVPILGGLCFAGGHEGGRVYPTIYKEIDEGEGRIAVEPVTDYPPNRLVKCGATGGACLLMHRQALMAMQRPWPKGFGTLESGQTNPYPWFLEGTTDSRGRPIGEDVIFCRRARAIGIPVHVHTGIKLGHVKTYVLDEQLWMERKVTDIGTTRAERRRAAREIVKAL